MSDVGHDSAGIIDSLMATLSKSLQRVMLVGNDEEMFLEFLTAPHGKHPWLRYGGRETLASYGTYGDSMHGFELPAKRLRKMIKVDISVEHIHGCVETRWPASGLTIFYQPFWDRPQ